MKVSPFDAALQKLREELAELSISQMLWRRKMAKTQEAINKCVNDLENAYKNTEMQAHIPQAAMISVLSEYTDLYDPSTNQCKDLNLDEFANSGKGQSLLSALDETDALTSQEKIQIKNELGLIKDSEGKSIKLTEQGLKEALAQYDNGYKGEVETDLSKFDHNYAGNLGFEETKELFTKLCDFIDKDCIDKELILSNIDEICSKDFLRENKHRSTTELLVEKMQSHLTEAQELKLSQEVLNIQFEDPENMRGQRSVAQMTASQTEKFSMITSISQAKDEQFTAVQKIVQQYQSVISKMPDKFTTRVGGETYQTKNLVSIKATQTDLERQNTKLSKTKLAKLERDNKALYQNLINQQKKDLALLTDDNVDFANQILEHAGSYALLPNSQYNLQLRDRVVEILGSDYFEAYPEEKAKLVALDNRIKEMDSDKQKYLDNPKRMKSGLKSFTNKRGETNKALDQYNSKLYDAKKLNLTKAIEKIDRDIPKIIDLGAKEELKNTRRNLESKLTKLETISKTALNPIAPDSKEVNVSKSTEKHNQFVKEKSLTKSVSKEKDSGERVRTKEE